MIMSNPEEISVLTKWLEQRLKEYFARKSRKRKLVSTDDEDYDWLLSLSANQSNGVPIETVIFDFRILDLELEAESDPQTFGNKLVDEVNRNVDDDDEEIFDQVKDELLKLPSKTDNEPYYKQRNSYVNLIYQAGSQSVGKELRLHMCASQFEHIKVNPSSGNKSSPKDYTLLLDEHQIDVYTKVIPILKEWVEAKNIAITIPIPECFYGQYESEESMVDSTSTKDGDKDDPILLADDDIMSKVAAGMEILEREKKAKAYMAACNSPIKQSGNRLLILEDIHSDGYKPKNVTGSTFLSLMNVDQALRSLAAIHSTSWAFSQKTGKSLTKIWPFLDNQSYVSYVSDRAMYGYPVMVGLVREYLTTESGQKQTTADQVPRILERLMKLRTRIVEIVEGIRNPSAIQCLIHQDSRFSSFLFRYSIQSNQPQKVRSNRESKQDSKKVAGSAASLSTKGTKGEGKRDSVETGLKREVMIINWRTASFGSPMIDVAFLLMTALPPMTRRAETTALLRIYWNTFQNNARKFGMTVVYSEKDMLEEYYAALLYSCVLITGNIEKGCKLNDDGIEVFVEAVKDLMEEGLM